MPAAPAQPRTRRHFRDMTKPIALATIGALLIGSTAPAAQAPTVRVLMSNGFKAVFDELAPSCERSIGRSIDVQTGTSASIVARVNAGERFDAVIATTDALDTLGKAGKVAAPTSLGRSGIGLGVRAGAKKPAIATAEALKQTFLAASSITYASGGASRPHIERMMTTLGIADAVSRKTVFEPDSVRAAARVAGGGAELLLTLISEILPAPGVDLVGPLPMQFQSYISFAGAPSASSANAAAGRSLISCLSGPGLEKALEARGMERGS